MLRPMQRNLLSAAYVALLSIMVVVGLNYEAVSPGLAAPGGDGPLFCRQLLSSGGDDEVMITAFGLFFLPLALRLVRMNRPVAGYEVVLLWVCLGVAGAALMLASLDCASILYTAFGVPDLWLAGAMLAMPAAAAALAGLRRADMAPDAAARGPGRGVARR